MLLILISSLSQQISDTPFPEVMEHGLYSLPFDHAEIIEEIHSSEDSSSEIGAGPGKLPKKKQKWGVLCVQPDYQNNKLPLVIRSDEKALHYKDTL